MSKPTADKVRKSYIGAVNSGQGMSPLLLVLTTYLLCEKQCSAKVLCIVAPGSTFFAPGSTFLLRGADFCSGALFLVRIILQVRHCMEKTMLFLAGVTQFLLWVDTIICCFWRGLYNFFCLGVLLTKEKVLHMTLCTTYVEKKWPKTPSTSCFRGRMF